MISVGASTLITNFLIGFVLLLLLTAGIVFIYLYFRLPRYKKDTRIINLMPWWTRGHATGYETKVTKHMSGRQLCSFFPTDITREEINEQKGLKPLTVVVDKGKRIVIPKGILSKNENVAFYLPRNTEDIYQTLGESELSKGFIKAVESVNALNVIFGATQEKDRRIAHHTIHYGQGEISEHDLKWMKEVFMENIREGIQEGQGKKEEKKKPGKDILDLS